MGLKEGEVICSRCEGRGSIPKKNICDGEIVTSTFCRRCHGTGKLDWIELCMGKRGIFIWGQRTLNWRKKNGT